MRLELNYRTKYSYHPGVRGGLTALRVRPVSRPGLEVVHSEITVSPGRVTTSYVDAWGTVVDLVEAGLEHDQATFEMTAEVETRPEEEQLPCRPDETYAYTRDSARVRLSAAAALGGSLGREGASWAAVESALAWLPQRFVFSVGATDATTEVETVIEQGSGVCQDFAHVFLCLLRQWGWCARYVSGYVFSSQQDVAQVDAYAMHAWVEVYRLGAGWVGLDATAGGYADDRYVAVGKGRDYDDVRPIRGVLVGRTSQSQRAHLSIRRGAAQPESGAKVPPAD